MKFLVLMSLMVLATNSFAMSFQECEKALSEGIFNSKAGEAFAEKMGKAMIEDDEVTMNKAIEITADMESVVKEFCSFATSK